VIAYSRAARAPAKRTSIDCAVALALAVQGATTEKPRRQIAFAFA
jgi:hypothetical protein